MEESKFKTKTQFIEFIFSWNAQVEVIFQKMFYIYLIQKLHKKFIWNKKNLRSFFMNKQLLQEKS